MSQPIAQPHSARPGWPWLALILIVYVAIASLYAIQVPAWQAPDEPAHYNYIHELASTGQFPVLRQGDYDETYLNQLKDERFPPQLSIEPVRYEAHQPPLYYLLASAVFRLTGGQLVFLRLFSVALGTLFIVLTYGIVRLIYPDRPRLRLAAAAFVAFLPMHVAIAASVNNDALAEVILAAILLLAIRYVKLSLLGPGQPSWAQPLFVGVMLGLALVTKVSAYVAIPVLMAALLIAWFDTRRTPRSRPATTYIVHAALIFLPALLIALPWYARNAQVYGHLDILGRRWHDLVVVGQLRTVDFLAQAGWTGLAERMGVWSFDSFWGVFGWMGVWMDGRLYTVLLAFSLAVLAGCVWVARNSTIDREQRLATGRDNPADEDAEANAPNTDHGPQGSGHGTHITFYVSRMQAWSLALLALSAICTLGIYLAYNLEFVQPQGRYLFPALPLVSLAVAVGWWSVTRWPAATRWAGIVLLAAAGLAALWGVTQEGINNWSLLILLGGAALFLIWSLVRAHLPGVAQTRLTRLIYSLPFVAMAILSLLALPAFVLPQLA